MNHVTNPYGDTYDLHSANPDEPNRLQLFPGGNGDWYIGTLSTGRASQSVVQITGAGGGKTNTKVLLAIAALYRAMRESAEEGKQ